MTGPKLRGVDVRHDDLATLDDVMQLIARLPYRDLVTFAEALEADASQISRAAVSWITPEEPDDAGA